MQFHGGLNSGENTICINGKVTGPHASQFYSVHVFFFFFFSSQSLLYCRHSSSHNILVFCLSRLKIDFLANVSRWEMVVGQQYFSLGFPTCQNKSVLPRPRSTLSLMNLTFQSDKVFSVVALTMMFAGLTVFDFIKPLAMAFAIFPPPRKPTFALNSLAILIRPSSNLVLAQPQAAQDRNVLVQKVLQIWK